MVSVPRSVPTTITFAYKYSLLITKTYPKTLKCCIFCVVVSYHQVKVINLGCKEVHEEEEVQNYFF